MRLRASSKCGRFFVSDVNPFDSFVGTDYVRDSIERVTRNTVNPLHSSQHKCVDEELRIFFLAIAETLTNGKRHDGEAGGNLDPFMLDVGT
jgi:hypothetical protein